MRIRKPVNISTVKKIKCSIVILMLLFFVNPLTAQEFRGVLPLNINTALHRDNSLNLYDFGSNPAWLVKDEKKNWFKVSPSFSNTSGDYRRLYDFEQSNTYGLMFSGVKPLPEGTFLGYAGYNVENRKNVYRSLKYNTYAGEAFFSTDSTTGNFSYKGPSLGFIYSYELMPGFFIGASGGYHIMEGLKRIYSKAQTLYRHAQADLGIAYEFSDNFGWGVTLGLKDSQEKINSQSDDLTQVEIYNYRGETYFITDRNNLVSQKVKKHAISIGSQIQYTAFKNLELALKSELREGGTKILIPRSNLDLEEGYADQKKLNFLLSSRYHISSAFLTGLYLGFQQNKSWSRNSQRNLLLWDWKCEVLKAGTGITYYFKVFNLLTAAEVEYNLTGADSNKYIDHRIANIRSHNYIIKFAAEYSLAYNILITAGFNRGNYPVDLVTGGMNLQVTNISLGFTKIWKDIQANLTLVYNDRKPESKGSRRAILTILELRYLTL